MRRYVSTPLMITTLVAMAAWGQPAIAAADAVACGSVLTTDTTLSADLDCREAGPAYALTIGAPGITLDLGGHQVLSDFFSAGGVLNDGNDDVTIRNGRVAGGFHGVVLTNGADGNVLAQLTGSSESDVLSATAVSDLTVDGVSNAVTDNSFAVGLTEVTEAIVSNVTTFDGIRMTRTTDSTVTGNTIGGSDMGGVVLFDSDRNVVADNTVRNNSGVNIYVDGADNRVLRNTLEFAQWNIQVTGDASGTLVQDNVADVANAGILVDAGTTGTVLDGNSATGGFPDSFFGTERYRGDGIHVESPSTTLLANTANDNLGWGIWAVAGVTDGGGNTATGNALGQCEGVDCGAVDPPECTIAGTDGDDVLVGTPGDDVLCGLGGDDSLAGQGGDDTLLGGEGDDTADYSTSPSGIRADLGTGMAIGHGTDTLDSVENITGSRGPDTLAGDTAANLLDGQSGHDRIDGFGGGDTLLGGAGNDRFTGGRGDDAIRGEDGTDTVTYAVQVSVDLELHRAVTAAGRVDDIRGVENVVGSDFDDVLRGSDVSNVLRGGRGADEIAGEGGADVLYGQIGADLLSGGGGPDVCDGGVGIDRANSCEDRVALP